MKALILCAGFGRRLGAHCAACPKPLLRLGDSTIIEYTLRRLSEAGIHDVFVNLHYRAERFPAQLGNGSRYGLRIHYRHESAPLGTAGTPRDLADELDGQGLLVHYGDIVSAHPLAELVDAHACNHAAATILVHQRADSNSYAYFGEGEQIDRFIERPANPPSSLGPSWAFSGICVLSASFLQAIPRASTIDLPADLFPDLARLGGLYGQRLAGYRWAIDSPERLADARAAFLDSRGQGAVGNSQ
ncbi:MAG: nucleotidyltransferase family protein [Nannocystaceae bacterium]